MKLKINEKDYSLVWGLPAIDRFCENVGHHDDIEKAFALAFPDDGSGDLPLATMKARVTLIQSALEIGAELNDDKLDLSKMQIMAWVNDADQSVLNDVWNDFFKSKYMSRSIEEYLFVSEAKEEDKPRKKSRQAS